MKHKIILPAILLSGALAVGTLGITQTYAQEINKYTPIVQRLAQRFGLKEEDVQSVFDEVHQERRAEMEARFLERLDQLVAEGKITQDQKQKLLDKQEELELKMEEYKNLEPTDRREKMKEFHQEMKKWADENDIEFPFMVFRTGFHKGLKAGNAFFSEKLN